MSKRARLDEDGRRVRELELELVNVTLMNKPVITGLDSKSCRKQKCHFNFNFNY